MLDGALHAIADGGSEQAQRDHPTALAGSARRSASCATSRSRSSRSCCATRASSAALRALADQIGDLARDRASSSTLDDADAIGETAQHRALHDPARARRAGDPPRPADAHHASTIAATADGGVRRRRSPTTPSPSGADARSRRSRSAPGSCTATVELARRRRHRDPRHAAGPHRPPLSAQRLRVSRSQRADENGAGAPVAPLCLVAARLPLRELDGDPPSVGSRARATTASAPHRQGRRLAAPRRPPPLRLLGRRLSASARLSSGRRARSRRPRRARRRRPCPR